MDKQMDKQEALHQYGFIYEPVGTHTRRSIAIDELRKLLASSEPSATYEEIRYLAIDQNLLGKATLASRKETFRVLRELYVLRPEVPLYSALRFFWGHSEKEQPLLALLCALARDPTLRESAAVVLPWTEGVVLPKKPMEDGLQAVYAGRYNPSMIAQLTRKLRASWTQSGHLSGYRVKIRSRALSGPASTAYAFFLGYLAGVRGNALFDTLWASALDAPKEELHEYAFQASRRGWIDYKNAGGIVDVGFQDLLGQLGVTAVDWNNG